MRQSYFLAIFALAQVFWFGCTKQTTEEAKSAEISGTLSFATWAPNQSSGMEANIKLFEQAYPDAKVELQVTPWSEYWQKLRTGASVGNLPDLFWMHVKQFALFASSDALLDMSDWIREDAEISLDNYPKDLVQLWEYEGRQYAIPKDFDTIALWYNKTLFDEAGLAYPDENWDWETLATAAKKLTDTEQGIWGYLANNHGQQGYWNYIYQNGGTVVRPDGRSGFDLPQTIEAIQRYVDFIYKDQVAPPLTEADDKLFLSGKIAMRMMGSWQVNSMNGNDYAKANLDLAILPYNLVNGEQKRATIYNGLGYAISAETEKPTAALAFAKILASEEGQRLQAEKSAAIPAFAGTLGPWAASFGSDFNLDAYPDQLPWAVGYPQAPGAAEWEPLMEERMGAIIGGEVPVEEGLKDLAQKMNAIIEENQ